MNYARIYAEFINDRKSKQPQKPDYFEKHHIIPRSLGCADVRSLIFMSLAELVSQPLVILLEIK